MKTLHQVIPNGLVWLALLLAAVGIGQIAAASPPGDAADTSAGRTETEPGASQPLNGQPLKRTDGLLIDAGTLNAQIDRANLRILDIRNADQYQEGHLPGAIRLDVARWRSKALEPGGLRDADYWAEEVDRLGVTSNSRVIVYGGSLPTAARAWWTLRYLGLADVALLDGGWPAWVEKKLPVEKAAPHVHRTRFKPEFQADRLAQMPELERAVDARSTKYLVLDARSKEEFTGEKIRGKRGGHIPDAVHLEWKDLVDESGRFKSHDDLVAMFNRRGVVRGRTIVTYCQSGGRASVEAFALELAGYQHVKNYYCSWQQWSADDTAPVEK